MKKARSNNTSVTPSAKGFASDQALVSVLQNLPVGVVIFSKTQILFINKKALKMFRAGKSVEQSIHNYSVFDFILPEYHKRIRESNKKIMAGEELNAFELKIKNTKDELIDVEVKSNTILFEGKKSHSERDLGDF